LELEHTILWFPKRRSRRAKKRSREVEKATVIFCGKKRKRKRKKKKTVVSVVLLILSFFLSRLGFEDQLLIADHRNHEYIWGFSKAKPGTWDIVYLEFITKVCKKM